MVSLLPSPTLPLSFSAAISGGAKPYLFYSYSTSRRNYGNKRLGIRAGVDLLGDFGARDPFPAEIESNFCEKVIGNTNTEHKILIPNLSALSLASRNCEPVPSNQRPMSMDDAKSLLKKVVGWRIVEDNETTKLQCLWKVRDYASAEVLINRINKATENVGHYPNLHLEEPNQVRAELWTASIGGLSLNDFIVAAKIDQVETLDLLPRKRVWA